MKIGQTNDIKFKVNVMGTSTEPKVRIILGTRPELSFPATLVGEEWTAAVDLPSSIEDGEYDLRVEVIVGNRHFTPLSKKVLLTAPRSTPAPIKPEAGVVPTLPTARDAEEAQPPHISVVPEQSVVGTPKKITFPPGFFKAAAPPPVKPEYRPIIARQDPVHTSIDKPIRKEGVKPGRAKKVVEIKHELPVRLVKGPVVYE